MEKIILPNQSEIAPYTLFRYKNEDYLRFGVFNIHTHSDIAEMFAVQEVGLSEEELNESNFLKNKTQECVVLGGGVAYIDLEKKIFFLKQKSACYGHPLLADIVKVITDYGFSWELNDLNL